MYVFSLVYLSFVSLICIALGVEPKMIKNKIFPSPTLGIYVFIEEKQRGQMWSMPDKSLKGGKIEESGKNRETLEELFRLLSEWKNDGGK